MLKKFSVSNYKGFENEITLDLSNTHDYKFNLDLVDSGISRKSLLYGKNGSGKSNLGTALMDISRLLTDNLYKQNLEVYHNMNKLEENAKFIYVFQFDKDEVKYEYKRKKQEILVSEVLYFNDKKVLDCDFDKKSTFIDIEGAESLDMNQFNYNMSLSKFIYSRKGYIPNSLFDKFYDFVNRMLFFRSLRNNEFQEMFPRSQSFAQILLESGKNEIRNLEAFLKEAGLDYNLCISYDNVNNTNEIYAVFAKKRVPLSLIWSTGTASLVLFYCWYLNLQKTSFLFLDEFDAFYHYELAEIILKKVNSVKTLQAIVTTHNCSLMSNKITRPDCCYLIFDNKIIKNLTQCTEREIREGHNLENLYKNGAFCE